MCDTGLEGLDIACLVQAGEAFVKAVAVAFDVKIVTPGQCIDRGTDGAQGGESG